MATNSTFGIGDFVRGSTGEIDQDQTIEKFRSFLVEYDAKDRARSQNLGVAVEAALDDIQAKKPGHRIALPVLATFALRHLPDVDADNYAEMEELVMQFVRDNSGDGKRYSMNKGKGGGVIRSSDIPVEAVKPGVTPAAPSAAPAPLPATTTTAPIAEAQVPAASEPANETKTRRTKVAS